MREWTARLRARLDCHQSLWCCQYVDYGMCNSWHDPHLLARWAFRSRARTVQFLEWLLRTDEPNDLGDGDE